MGLDMYLSGKKTFGGHWGSVRQEDGLPVEKIEVSLGYWRKHQLLHDYIVQTFANGVDNCEPIDLTVEQVNEIIDAVKNNGDLYDYSSQTPEEVEQYRQIDLAILGKALVWVTFDNDPPDAKPMWKNIYYVASW